MSYFLTLEGSFGKGTMTGGKETFIQNSVLPSVPSSAIFKED